MNSNYLQIIKRLSDLCCVVCSGHGTVDDAEPGDISFNTYRCPKCQGTGFNDGEYYTLHQAKEL